MIFPLFPSEGWSGEQACTGLATGDSICFLHAVLVGGPLSFCRLKGFEMSEKLALFLTLISAILLENVLAPGTACAADEAASDSQTELSTESELKDWKPQLEVTLRIVPAGVAQAVKRTVRVPYYKVVYEQQEQGANRTQTPTFLPPRAVAVRKLAWREEEVMTSVAGIASVYCDELSVNITKDKDDLVYSFDCPGRIHVRFGQMILDCDSGKLSNGKLELVNAKMVHQGMDMTSDKMSLSLPVVGVKTAQFGRPLSDVPDIPLAGTVAVIEQDSSQSGELLAPE